MSKTKPAYLLLILLISVAIIAIIVFASGNFTTLLGPKSQPGTVNYQLNDMTQKVNNYNQIEKDALSK